MKTASGFTQGGQVTLHNFRMIKQVVNVTLVMSLVLSLFYFSGRLWFTVTPEERNMLLTYSVAQAKLLVPIGPIEKKTQIYTDLNGRSKKVRCIDVVRNPYMLGVVHRFESRFIDILMETLGVFLASVLLICWIWHLRGKKLSQKTVLSGSSLVKSKVLAKMIKEQKSDSDISFCGVPIIKGSETQHILMSGTTGSGKTNAFNHLMLQVRKRNEKAIIVDTTGDLLAKHFNPETDMILNPLDIRSKNWDMWSECSNHIQMDELASGIIPQALSDPFWTDSSRSIFVETLYKLSKDKEDKSKVSKLLYYSVRAPLEVAEKFFKNTSVSAIVHKSADKTCASIRMNLATYIKPVALLQETDDPFSIRDWIKDDEQRGWLFLVSLPEQRETLRPLLTSWLNVAINGLMSCIPSPDRRVWFFIDEKQSLNKIEALPKALAEIRKYGGCIVSGLQNVSQIEQLYGNATARSMISLYNTKLFFRAPESNTASWIAKTIGENEVIEHSEGISFGAHQMRDGVSLNEQKRFKSIVNYSDFMDLADLTAYLKLGGQYPVTKISFEYLDLPRVTESYIENLSVLSQYDNLDDLFDSSDTVGKVRNEAQVDDKIQKIGIGKF